MAAEKVDQESVCRDRKHTQEGQQSGDEEIRISIRINIFCREGKRKTNDEVIARSGSDAAIPSINWIASPVCQLIRNDGIKEGVFAKSIFLHFQKFIYSGTCA